MRAHSIYRHMLSAQKNCCLAEICEMHWLIVLKVSVPISTIYKYAHLSRDSF